MNSKTLTKGNLSSGLSRILGKTKKPTNVCRICGLTFPNPERTHKHMIKAHSKPKRSKD